MVSTTLVNLAYFEIFQCIHHKVCFAAREWIVFRVHPVAARPGPAAHVFLVVSFLCQKTVDI